MKAMYNRKRLFVGVLLFILGIALLFVPQLFHLQEEHEQISHAVIVLGATGIFIGFTLLIPKKRV